jgi:protein-S-isoprenylcysteine O-methyltransferase Ste14
LFDDSNLAFIGFVIILIGGWLIYWANNTLKRYKTPADIFKEPTNLILDGPFAFSRNPMYLGMTIMLLGISLLFGSIAAFSAPILFFITANTDLIPREEKQLYKVFENRYADYAKNVGKWI